MKKDWGNLRSPIFFIFILFPSTIPLSCIRQMTDHAKISADINNGPAQYFYVIFVPDTYHFSPLNRSFS